jgi:hypothetical protein
VLQGGVWSNSVPLTVITPQITTVSPTTGIAGTQVTITGTGFGASQGSGNVWMGNTYGVVVSWSDTQVVATIASGAKTGTAQILQGGVWSNSVSFTVSSQPTLMSLAIAPQNPSLSFGRTQQFTAMGTYTDGSTKDITGTATWNSAAPAVATISSTGLASTVGIGQTTIQAAVGAINGSTLLSVTSSFVATGTMSTARYANTATLLNDGTVLITGGWDNTGNVLASAEIYNPTTGNFTATSNLNTEQDSDTATLLNNGLVLIAGGTNASTELYNPMVGSFTSAGAMSTARHSHTATLLNNGMVLIAGGTDNNNNTLATAELYNPTTGTSSATGSLNTGRNSHLGTLLNNGKVLITGGQDTSGNLVASAELYDPATGSFTYAGNLNTGRGGNTATLLNNGMVLIAGGWDNNGNALASTELFDPVTGSFTFAGNLSTGRGGNTATLLNNGMVLITGGWDNVNNALASSELFDPATGSFTFAGSLNTGRGASTATLLNNGMVLIVGGSDINNNNVAAAELYLPGTLTPAGLVSIALSPLNASVPAGTAQHFTATGTFSDNNTQTLASVTWNSSDTTVAVVSNDSTNPGQALGEKAGSAIVNACAGAICGSATITVSPSLLPSITNVSPNSGPVGFWVEITGTNFGATQGSSSVLFGGIAAQVVVWTDTTFVAILPASVPVGVAIPVLVVTSNGTSNTVFFTPTASPATSYNVSPQSLSMLVGQSRTVTVTENNGTPVKGLYWMASNPTIVSLSTDDPPVITALAPGSTTVYAGGAPLLVTVYAGSALPPGTPVWSLPLGGSGGGSGTVGLVPAVPSASGVDVFALDNSGTLSAVSSDGKVVWSVTGAYGEIIPDFSGNALLKAYYNYEDWQGNEHNTHRIQKVDPSTAQMTNLYTFSDRRNPPLPNYFSDQGMTQIVIPHPEGALFVQDQSKASVIDPATTQLIGSVTLENTTWTWVSYNGNSGSVTQGPDVGQMIVAGDGNAYLPYSYFNDNTSYRSSASGDYAEQRTTYLLVLRISPDGTYAKTQLRQWTYSEDCSPSASPTSPSCTSTGLQPDVLGISAITNGGTGVAVFATTEPNDLNFHVQLNYISQDIITSQIDDVIVFDGNNGTQVFLPKLQREDGSYIGFGGTGDVIAVGAAGGVLWSQQITSTPTWLLTPLYATSDGGVIVTSTQNGQLGTLYTLDQNGNVASQTPDTGAVYSWSGESYVSFLSSGAGISEIELPLIDVDAASFWSETGGNPSQNGVAIPLCPCLDQSTGGVSSKAGMPWLNGAAYPPPATQLTGGSKYVLLEGDPGLSHPPSGISHNVGNLFNRAAETKSNSLISSANSTVVNRVSSVQDFNTQLTSNGYIDGGIIYFGHGGPHLYPDGSILSILAPGQGDDPSTNVASYNVGTLSNAQLGPSATIVLNTCRAGFGRSKSIAQLLANQLRRKVYAYPVGMFFSTDPAARFPSKDQLPDSTPMYMIPWGGVEPIQFKPQ